MTLKQTLSRRYHEVNSWAGEWPFCKANLTSFIRDAGVDLSGITLNAGRGEVDYKLTAENEISIDIDFSQRPDVAADLHRIPLKEDTVDTVVAICVLEHVARPWDVVKEFHRILKPNGKLIVEVPFINPTHAAPHDFYRFSMEGLGIVLADGGFQVFEKRISQPASYGVLWLWWKKIKAIKFYPARLTSLLFLKVVTRLFGLRDQRLKFEDSSDYAQFLVAAEKIPAH